MTNDWDADADAAAYAHCLKAWLAPGDSDEKEHHRAGSEQHGQQQMAVVARKRFQQVVMQEENGALYEREKRARIWIGVQLLPSS